MMSDNSTAADHNLTLTAGEFLAAVRWHSHAAPTLASVRLQNLEAGLRRCLTDAALLAQQLADGGLTGELLLQAFLSVERGAGLVEREVQALETDARGPEGESAAAALAHVVRRVVSAVYGVACAWATPGVSEDDGDVYDTGDDAGDWPHEYEVLTWETTAPSLRKRFSAGFTFPDPAPLLRRMRDELMQLDGRQVTPDGYGPRVGPQDDEPVVPMKNAARSKKGKTAPAPQPEPEQSPLPVLPHPVYIVQPPNMPVPVVMVDGAAGDKAAGRTQPAVPTVYYHGGRSYSADGKHPREVNNERHNMLAAFLDGDQALSTVALADKGVSNVSRVAKELAKLFGAAVRIPKSDKGAGYYIRVRNAPGRPHQAK